MARTIEGIGVGLRKQFIEPLLKTKRQIDFLEVTPENWVRYGGKSRRWLDACSERWPIVPHSVSLSVGGPDPLDDDFLGAMADLCERLGSPFYSDHVCYSTVNGNQLHDLLPLPFSEEAVEHTAKRAREVRRRMGVPLVLENATFYSHMPGSTLDEATFLNAVLEQGRADMLLDVNNVYVNSQNHHFDPRAFIDRMPLERVSYLHLAGHTPRDNVIIDTHIGPIIEPVWALYRYTLARAGRLIPTLIEWDQDIPELDVVLDEIDLARAHAKEALQARSKSSASADSKSKPTPRAKSKSKLKSKSKSKSRERSKGAR
jgi:uncharacterized protein (UPF0276 family)